jgi:hypothetical protein
MRYARAFSSVAFVSGALFACSGGGGSTGGSASDSSSFASEYCGIFGSCCGKAGYPSDGAQCRSYFNNAAGGREYNAAKGEECLAGFRAASSQPDFCEKGETPPACSEVFRTPGGGAAPGATCEQDEDCASSTEGEVECHSSSTGGALTRICQVQVRGKEGDACVGTKDGSSSVSFGSSGSGGPPPKVTFCNTADNLACDNETDKCTRIQDVGGPCSSSGSLSYACVKTAYCDTQQKKCAARLPAGADCAASFSSDACADKHYCDQATKKCTAKLAQGAPCERSDQCESNTCTNKKCEASGLAELGYLLLCGPKANP